MSAIETYNYYNDPRVTTRLAGAPVLMLEDEDGNGFREIELPSRYEVCDLCDGHGSHVNPSIDSGGLSADEFYDDPDFYEDYRNGEFDVPCAKCGGKRVVPVVDESRCDPVLFAQYQKQLSDDAAYHAECMAELRMGC